MADEHLEGVNHRVEDVEGGDAMYEHYQILVDKKQVPIRIDKFLVNRLSKTRNKIQQAAKADCLLVNDKPVKANFKIKPLHRISVLLPKPLENYEIVPEEMDLDIVYEDDEVLVINKSAGLVVHPGVGNYSGTLVHGLSHYLKGLEVPSKPHHDPLPRPGIVHRIDKMTTGLLITAKTENALVNLSKQFFDHTIVRRYVALVWGDVKEEEGTIEANLGRDPKHRRLMTVFEEEDQGKHAITHYKVLERLGYVTLIECRLETGRTHQIRVHMKHIGHPLFGDQQYGGDRIVKGTVYTKYKQFVENCFKLIPRQALHAKVLGFVHPGTGEDMRLESPLPEDMQQVLEKWRKYVGR